MLGEDRQESSGKRRIDRSPIDTPEHAWRSTQVRKIFAVHTNRNRAPLPSASSTPLLKTASSAALHSIGSTILVDFLNCYFLCDSPPQA